MGDFADPITFGSYSFEDVTDINESLNTRTNEVTIPRRNGALIPDTQVVGTRTVSLRGVLHARAGEDAEDVRTRFDNLREAVYGGEQDLVIWDDGRLLKAVIKNFSYSYPNGVKGRVVDWQASFICADPFYRTGLTYIQTDASTYAQNTNLGIEGNAPTDCLIQCNVKSASASGLTYYILPASAKVSDYLYRGIINAALQEDDVVQISSLNGNYILNINGTPSLTYFNGDFPEFPTDAVYLRWETGSSDGFYSLALYYNKYY